MESTGYTGSMLQGEKDAAQCAWVQPRRKWRRQAGTDTDIKRRERGAERKACRRVGMGMGSRGIGASRGWRWQGLGQIDVKSVWKTSASRGYGGGRGASLPTGGGVHGQCRGCIQAITGAGRAAANLHANGMAYDRWLAMLGMAAELLLVKTAVRCRLVARWAGGNARRVRGPCWG